VLTADTVERYVPRCDQEEADRALMRTLLRRFGDTLLTRENAIAHFTASSMIFSPDRSHVLMAYHNLYHSWAWTGGHADGEDDPMAVAMREAREETGVRSLLPLANAPVALDVLPVWGHVKRGAYVSTHLHLNLTYAFSSGDTDGLRVKADENSGVRWIPVASLSRFVTEAPMLPIYNKIIHPFCS
jgi:8-oxo-dGTP pyrophosphatase MutT (NUDIX family)